MSVKSSIPRHVAIIMDGNGRWANQRGENRLSGHAQGTESVRKVINASVKHGVGYLTLFVFSTENWQRPSEEVEGLMELLCSSILQEKQSLKDNGIRVRFIGNTAVMAEKVREHISMIEAATSGCDILNLQLAFNYGSREEMANAIVKIAELVTEGELMVSDINAGAIGNFLYTAGIPDPDLVIRTSGEQRLSNFLLWQAAYSELYFTPVLWPDFGEEEFERALSDYACRERRYGAI